MFDLTEDPELHRVLGRARELGFLGPGPIRDHLEHAKGAVDGLVARWGPDLEGCDAAVDLGSGGGLPGLPLAVAFPAVSWCLVDAAERRIAFLGWAIEALGLGSRVRAVRGRAEVLAHAPEHRGRYGLVTARSFGAPATTAECAVGFLRPDGVLLVSEPPEPDPSRWPSEAMGALGLEVVHTGRWMEAQLVGPLDPAVPRREGMPGKRPRW